MTTIKENQAVKLLNNVTLDIFSKVSKNSDDFDCHLILVKVQANQYDYHYATIDSKGIIEELSLFSSKLIELETYFYEQSEENCNYDINSDYIKEVYQSKATISFLLFNKNNQNYNLCGFLFLENKFQDKANKVPVIYIQLVCAAKRASSEKTGLGTKFLNLAEKVALYLNCKKVTLSAVDTAISFYRYKGYRISSGKKTFKVTPDAKLTLYDRQGKLIQDDFSTKAYFTRGELHFRAYDYLSKIKARKRTKKATKTKSGKTTFTLPLRKSTRVKTFRTFNPKSNISLLKNVALDHDGLLLMEKVVAEPVVTTKRFDSKSTTKVTIPKFTQTQRKTRSRARLATLGASVV